MKELSLIELKVEKINFVNDVQVPEESGSIDVQIDTNITAQVKINRDNTKCKCELTVELIPNPQVNFGATIVVVGIFDCESIQDTQDIRKLHIASCQKLFPHVQATTSSFMNMVGFPNFVIEEPDIEQNAIIEENIE